MQDEQRNESQFDLIRFASNSLRFLRRTFWLVLAAGVLGALLMAFYAQRTYSPKYECHAVLSVRVDNSTVTDVIGTGDKTNASYTKQLVTTFPTIIQSDSMRERIMREMGTTRINGTITPSVIANSSLFTLTVRSSTPENAYRILNAVIKCYPDMAFVYIGAASITLIEAPVMPTAPVKTLSTVRPAVIGGLVAALIVLAILCLLAQLQTVVTSSSDLKPYTGVPCIVHVPQTQLKRRATGSNQLSLRNEHLPPVYVEAIRVLSARVLRFCREQNLHRLLVTSTVPGEGKSTIAANLAQSLARSGMRVILIDADLRTQELREFFGIEGEPRGLKELLQNPKLRPEDCLTPVGDTGVQLLCGGRIDRPVSLLRRGKLSALLDQLDALADVILIDTPPIGLLTDAAAFAQHSDAAIYVVRAGAVAGQRIADSMQAVADCRTKILGYVLNGVSAKSGSHGYGYRYSYGYGYGSRYGSGYGSSYGGSSYRSSTYGHYGHYGSYGGYGGYGDYGSYGAQEETSASDEQKRAEKTRKQRRSAAPAESEPSRERPTPPQAKPTELPKLPEDHPGPVSRPAQKQPETPKTRDKTAPRENENRSKDRKREPAKASVPEAPKAPAVRAAELPQRAPETPGKPDPFAVEAAQAAPIPKRSDYDDPELEAIVREVLANTTEEDVRRAYETLEAETAHRATQPRQQPAAAEHHGAKKNGLFHRSHDRQK